MTKHIYLIYLLMFSFGLFEGHLKAQGNLTTTDLDSPELQLRIKNIDDFINRFNFTRDEKGNILKYDSSMRHTRERTILWLCSKELFKTWYFSDSAAGIKPKPMPNNLLAGFVKTVALDSLPIFLNFSENWTAEANCTATYKGKPENLRLWMSMVTDTVTQGMKWVIDSVDAAFLALPAHEKLRLNPVSHNLNFMDLGKTSEINPASFVSYAAADFSYDQRAVLFWLISNKSLKIEFVTDLKFHFDQIPGYQFTVENMTAKGAHGGWLITQIKEVKYL